MRLQGKNNEGSFHTAQKKTYPGNMCRALARSIVDACARFMDESMTWDDVGESDEIRHQLQQLHVPWDPFRPHEIAPDFA
eukprot:7636937-Pyramimonas_sp.AAC.1